MRRPCKNFGYQARGFTLVEVVVVMVVMAALAAGVAVFIAYPVQSYQLTVRRAELVDSANAAFQRMSRELNTALPNSVRVTTVGGVTYLEFLQTRTGGRYRDEPASPSVPSSGNTCPDSDGDTFADEDVMTFGVPDTCFRTLGPVDTYPPATTPVAGDYLVIYNLGPGYIGANAYAAVLPSNKSLITGFAASVNNENRITFAANTFPLDSPGRRFQIVSGPVTFACDPVNGQLLRYGGYAIAAGQPTPPVGVGVTPFVLANRVTGCAITYNVVNTRTSVVDIALQLSATDGGATPANVSLFNQVQVSNVP